MSITKKKAFNINYNNILNKANESNNLIAFAFSQERAGVVDREFRATLKEHQIYLYYVKLNIIRKFLKNKNIKGINNRIALLSVESKSDLTSFVTILLKKNLILVDCFYKNIRIKPSFLNKKQRQITLFKQLVEKPIYLLKKIIVIIIKINKRLNDNK